MRAQDVYKRQQKQFASTAAFVRERLLSDALSGAADAQALLSRAGELNLALSARRYLVILACLRGSGEERTLAQSALYRLADGSGEAVYACEAQGGFALIVLGDSDEALEERAYGFAQAALYEMERAANAGARM